MSTVPLVRRVRAAVIVIVTGLAVIGAAPALLRHAHAPAHARQPAATSPSSITRPLTQTIVAVGDSITKGDWDTEVKGGWVTRLADKLQRAYPQATFVVRNAGVDGDTTAGVLARLTRDVLAPNPALVIVSIGTNDFDMDVPPATFATELHTLAARLRDAAHPPVVILASMLPIAGQTPSRLAAERAYNDVIRRTAAEANAGYLDLFDPWLALGPYYLHALRHDTEHPNPIGYELLASTTAAFLEAGYLDDHGRVTAPAVAPTCSPALAECAAVNGRS